MYWEQQVSRPGLNAKNYHNASIVLIDIHPDASAEYAVEWESLLPFMRIANTFNGTSRLNNVKDRDSSSAWPYILSLDTKSHLLLDLLDPQSPWPYRPLFTPLANTASSEIGIAPPTKTNAPPQTQGGEHSNHSISASLLLHHPLLHSPSSLTAEPQATGTPTSSDPESKTSKILAFLDQIRSKIITSEQPSSIRRTGYIPTTSAEQISAKTLLVKIYFTFACGIIICLLSFALIWRKSRSRSVIAGMLIGFSSVLVNSSTLIAQVPFDSYRSTNSPPHCQTENTEQAHTLLATHCSLAQQAGLATNAEALWSRITSNHSELMHLIPSRHKDSLPSSHALMNAVKEYYKDIRYEPEQSSNLSKADRYSPQQTTLQSAIFHHRGDCYSLSLLYLLHARLAGVPMSMIVTPTHAMLCDTAEQLTVPIETSCEWIYDVASSRWLTSRFLNNSLVMVDNIQIGSILAYNLGTRLILTGQRQSGRECLHRAIELRFPFSDALLNLCISYANEGKHSDVIDLLTSRQDASGSTPSNQRPYNTTSRHVTPFEPRPELPRSSRDINRLHVISLTKMGRLKDAQQTAEMYLRATGRDTDFQLYRLYIQLRNESPSLNTSFSKHLLN